MSAELVGRPAERRSVLGQEGLVLVLLLLLAPSRASAMQWRGRCPPRAPRAAAGMPQRGGARESRGQRITRRQGLREGEDDGRLRTHSGLSGHLRRSDGHPGPTLRLVAQLKLSFVDTVFTHKYGGRTRALPVTTPTAIAENVSEEVLDVNTLPSALPKARTQSPRLHGKDVLFFVGAGEHW